MLRRQVCLTNTATEPAVPTNGGDPPCSKADKNLLKALTHAHIAGLYMGGFSPIRLDQRACLCSESGDGKGNALTSSLPVRSIAI